MRFVGPTQLGLLYIGVVIVVCCYLRYFEPNLTIDIAKTMDGAFALVLLIFTMAKSLFPGYHLPPRDGTTMAIREAMVHHQNVHCSIWSLFFLALHLSFLYRQMYVLTAVETRAPPLVIVLNLIGFGVLMLQAFLFFCRANNPLSNMWFMDRADDDLERAPTLRRSTRGAS